ncbi:MAG TPA: ABC transporter ATP-binding protein, partial [Chloroflexota bacterium]|nr:ABC transporter ATP-binding protein [Chloroflexota bacterium]
GGSSLMLQQKATLKTSPWALTKRLGSMIAEHRRQLLLATGCVLGASALQMLMPWAFKHVIDVTVPSGNGRELVVIGVGLLVMQLVRYFLSYSNRYLVALISQQLVYRIAKDVFEHVQRLSLRFFERWGTGEIISRITNDIQVMQQAVQGGTVQAAVSLVNMLAFAIIMALLNWQLALLVYATVPLLLLASWITAEKLRVRYLVVQEKVADVNNVLQENISGVRVSKAFAREGEQRRRFSDQNRGNLSANMSTATVQALATPAIQMISTLGMAIVLGVGTWQILQGTLTVGTLVAFVSYLIQFYQPVEDLIRVNNTVQQALAAAERIFEYIDERPDVYDRPGANVLSEVKGEVAFENVTFAYEPGKPVLHDVSLRAAAGQIVALVGHTGSGKTTMVNLIPRFYDPDAGRLTLDGHDLRDVTLESLRDQIAVVVQETFLFGATIADNIRYGRLEATDEEVVSAAKQANAHEFISQLEDGYNSWAGEGGVLLSRGQRQRIALARAILKDPRILILDEATSDVDTETELLIQRALEQVMQGRTTFVIAHRLSTIRHADQIIVLDHGRIVERGTHTELLAAGGHYRDLYDAQFAGQEVAQARIDQLSRAVAGTGNLAHTPSPSVRGG